MKFSSPEELSYEEPTLSRIHQEPRCHVPLTTCTTEMMEAEPSPSPTPSSSEPQPNPETQKTMPESFTKDLIHLFPHSTSDLIFNITPLTSLPPPSAPILAITSKPTKTSQPRTSTSAPSSPRKEAEGKNLIPSNSNG